MNINEWTVFSFLIFMSLFSILQVLIEFSYYATSVCKQSQGFPKVWLYFQIIITSLGKLTLIFIFLLDISFKSRSRVVIFYPFVLPTLLFGATPAALMPMYNFDFFVCEQRHYFFSMDFAIGWCIFTTFYDVFLLLLFITSLCFYYFSKTGERAGR